MKRVLLSGLLMFAPAVWPGAKSAVEIADPFPWRVVASDCVSGSPDGRFVVVRHSATWTISLMERATKRERVLIEGAGRWPTFFWSPDSRELAYSFKPDDAKRAQVYVISTAGGLPQKLTIEGEVAGWTAHREVFVRSGGAYVLVPAGGSQPVREVVRGVREAAITPDGESVIIRVQKTSPIVVRNLRTGPDRPTLRSPEQRSTSFGRMEPDTVSHRGSGRSQARKKDRPGSQALRCGPCHRRPSTHAIRHAHANRVQTPANPKGKGARRTRIRRDSTSQKDRGHPTV